jgi:hypothetical protein
VHALSRWPLLLGGALLASAGIGLELTTQEPVAYALWALAAACFGAWLYHEGAAAVPDCPVCGHSGRYSRTLPPTLERDDTPPEPIGSTDTGRALHEG